MLISPNYINNDLSNVQLHHRFMFSSTSTYFGWHIHLYLKLHFWFCYFFPSHIPLTNDLTHFSTMSKTQVLLAFYWLHYLTLIHKAIITNAYTHPIYSQHSLIPIISLKTRNHRHLWYIRGHSRLHRYLFCSCKANTMKINVGGISEYRLLVYLGYF